MKRKYNLNKPTNSGGTMYISRKTYTDKKINIISEHSFGKSASCKRCEYFQYIHGVKKIKYTDVIDGVNVLCEMKRV